MVTQLQCGAQSLSGILAPESTLFYYHFTEAEPEMIEGRARVCFGEEGTAQC